MACQLTSFYRWISIPLRGVQIMIRQRQELWWLAHFAPVCQAFSEAPGRKPAPREDCTQDKINHRAP